jgi:hypothetical protein
MLRAGCRFQSAWSIEAAGSLLAISDQGRRNCTLLPCGSMLRRMAGGSLGLAVGAVLLVACGSGGAGSHGAAVVPGGVRAIAASGSPSLCSRLATSTPLTGLSEQLAAIASGTPTAATRTTIDNAAHQLTDLAHGQSGVLGHDLNAVANSISGLVGAGAASSADFVQLGAALTQLGKDVQATCHFPIGQ